MTRRRSPRTARVTPITKAVAPPPIRLDRVRTALERIANGYYDRDEVRSRLANEVLEEIRRN